MTQADILLLLAGEPLATYLRDTTTIEVLVNPNGSCFVERFGQGMREAQAIAPGDLDRFLAGIADMVEQEWRASSPSLHAALPGLGWRIQAAMPPQSPALTMALRTHRTQAFPLSDFLAKGILTARQGTLLQDAIHNRKRVIVSGATGSAKTSLATALLGELAATDARLVILEDDPEIQARAKNAMFLRTGPGRTMTQLVKEALRYRPDRLIVGEIRDGAAHAMAQAFRTGHAGLATVHAESAATTLPVLEEWMHQGSPTASPQFLAEAIDLIVHMERHATTWRCSGLLAVHGYASGAYVTEPLE